MPLFRFHRGGLEESLKTTVVVTSDIDLLSVISNTLMIDPLINDWAPALKIEPYPSANNFDERIGWYTHIVLANTLEQYKFHPVGFMSEPPPNNFFLLIWKNPESLMRWSKPE